MKFFADTFNEMKLSMIFCFFVLKHETTFFSAFIWKWLTAILTRPQVDLFTPVLLGTILKYNHEMLLRTYGRRFLELLRSLK